MYCGGYTAFWMSEAGGLKDKWKGRAPALAAAAAAASSEPRDPPDCAELVASLDRARVTTARGVVGAAIFERTSLTAWWRCNLALRRSWLPPSLLLCRRPPECGDRCIDCGDAEGRDCRRPPGFLLPGVLKLRPPDSWLPVTLLSKPDRRPPPPPPPPPASDSSPEPSSSAA